MDVFRETNICTLDLFRNPRIVTPLVNFFGSKSYQSGNWTNVSEWRERNLVIDSEVWTITKQLDQDRWVNWSIKECVIS